MISQRFINLGLITGLPTITMGRIKTKLVKRVTFDIIEKHSDKLKKTFEENKKIVAKLADLP